MVLEALFKLNNCFLFPQNKLVRIIASIVVHVAYEVLDFAKISTKHLSYIYQLECTYINWSANDLLGISFDNSQAIPQMFRR